MLIKIKKLNPLAQIPSAGSAQAAGCDLYACIEEGKTVIGPHQTVMIGTGIAAAIPEGFFGGIFARSGLAAGQGLRPANCVGVVDPDYRGEFKVALHNDSDRDRVVEHGERIAQLVVLPFLPVDFEEVDELDQTQRGQGGFGHTGLK